jgi:hypothetical protein
MAEYYAQPVAYPSPPPQPDGRVEPRPEGLPMHAHEGTDVAIRPLVIIGVGLVIFLIATCVFLVFLFELYSTVENKGTTKVTAVTGAKVEVPENVPPLQGVPGYHDNTPAKDMNEFRKKNQELLSGYSTASNGVARIPVVDKETGRGGLAMDLALQRKLFPTAATQPAASPNNGAVPGAGSPAQREPLGGRQRVKTNPEKETE